MNLTDIIFFKNNNGLTNPLRFSELLPLDSVGYFFGFYLYIRLFTAQASASCFVPLCFVIPYINPIIN